MRRMKLLISNILFDLAVNQSDFINLFQGSPSLWSPSLHAHCRAVGRGPNSLNAPY